MPSYRYLGPKVYRRITIPPTTEPPPPTHTEVQPGDVVDDLSAAELAAFGDRFALVEGDEPAPALAPAEAPAEIEGDEQTPALAPAEAPAEQAARTRRMHG